MSQASQARLVFCTGLFVLVAFAGTPMEMQQPAPTGMILPTATSLNLYRQPDTETYSAESAPLTPRMEWTARDKDAPEEPQRQADSDRNQAYGRRVGELADALSAALAERRRITVAGSSKETSAAASDKAVRTLLRAINAEVRRKRD